MVNAFKEFKGFDSIEIAKTKITIQQIIKYFLHWALLILVHFMVFWYYPLKGNYSLYETPSCPADAPYGCRDFKNNTYLLLFYLFYCAYFLSSAL